MISNLIFPMRFILKEPRAKSGSSRCFVESNYLLTSVRWKGKATSLQDSIRWVSLSLRGSISYYLIGVCRGSSAAVYGIDMKSTRHLIWWRYDDLFLCLFPILNSNHVFVCKVCYTILRFLNLEMCFLTFLLAKITPGRKREVDESVRECSRTSRKLSIRFTWANNESINRYIKF
jgi:hypothetical protein